MTEKIEGFLEVGCNDQDEVVINHSDLTPDENGVGHIVFSVNQARNLARILLKQADLAAASIKAKEPPPPPPPPVDRNSRVLADGRPVPEDESHRELKANGQQKEYVVLSTAERARGFVRPVRQTYTHVGARPKNPLRNLTEEEKRGDAGCGYVKYEAYPEGSAAIGRFWTQEQLSSGCGTDTTMSLAIAETYARDNQFYNATFCVFCGKHLPLDQFVWKGTREQVGS